VFDLIELNLFYKKNTIIFQSVSLLQHCGAVKLIVMITLRKTHGRWHWQQVRVSPYQQIHFFDRL